MRKFLAISMIASIMVSCSSNGLAGLEYKCEEPNGKFGSVLRFKKGGKMFLDLVPREKAEKSEAMRRFLDVAGEYEVVDDMIIVKYHDGFQTHSLNKVGNTLTSNTDIFRICKCTTE